MILSKISSNDIKLWEEKQCGVNSYYKKYICLMFLECLNLFVEKINI